MRLITMGGSIYKGYGTNYTQQEFNIKENGTAAQIVYNYTLFHIFDKVVLLILIPFLFFNSLIIIFFVNTLSLYFIIIFISFKPNFFLLFLFSSK